MKKTLCIILALAMAFALAACGEAETEASPTPTYYDGSTPSDLLGPSPKPTPTPDPQPVTTLTVNGINLVRDGQKSIIGVNGFDYDDGVLTITDVTLQGGSADEALIHFDGGALEIVVKGEVTLAASGGASVISADEGHALTISGDGQLTVSASGAPALDIPGGVTAGCALNCTGEPACTGEAAAAAGFAVTVNDGATLTVNAVAN